ncbi:MAG: hypothetical protein KBF37_06905 [Saprospiraceae bacterium]|jgi:hypothetical protein|nr:hypothetical protein [Saprospiraceae bacterium]MBP9210030.1 hypothetical protein [Saprospiraceae bacterium]MBV6472877.1 hypothetical protein [Saprospiraceae bacterium]
MHSSSPWYFILCLLIAACKDERTIDAEFLRGKWVVYEAYRNEKKTNTLEGAYFFFEGQIMSSNFLGQDQQAEFKLVKNKLHLVKGLKLDLDLKKTGPASMEMKVEIQNTPFAFYVKRE